MTILGFKIGAKVLGIIAAIALVVGLLLWGPAACNAYRSLTAQNRVNQAQSNAFGASAGDALATQGNASANAIASEELTARNREDIRHAEGSDQSINPAVRDAGFASLCKRPSFRNSPTGRLRCPAAAGVAQPR
jgi:hypothetical protein